MWATYDADFDETDARENGRPKGEQVRRIGIDPDRVEQGEQRARGDSDAQLRQHVKHAAAVADEVLRAGPPDAPHHRQRHDQPRERETDVAGAPPLANSER